MSKLVFLPTKPSSILDKVLAFMDKNSKNPFDILVISAPSGTGKSTLNKKFLTRNTKFELSISYTTRDKRKGDQHGVDYNFITTEAFKKQIENENMLEYAKVFNNYYGTSLDEIKRIQKQNHTPLLEIDVQGWEQVQQKHSRCLSIFILPPSIKELWQRLTKRDSDSRQVQINRIISAKNEILNAKKYGFFIVNNNLEESLEEMEQIVHTQKGSLDHAQGLAHANMLLQEYEDKWFLDILHEKQRYDQQKL